MTATVPFRKLAVSTFLGATLLSASVAQAGGNCSDFTAIADLEAVCDGAFCGTFNSNLGSGTITSGLDPEHPDPIRFLPNGTQVIRAVQLMQFESGPLAGTVYTGKKRGRCRFVNDLAPETCQLSMTLKLDHAGSRGVLKEQGWIHFGGLPASDTYLSGRLCTD